MGGRYVVMGAGQRGRGIGGGGLIAVSGAIIQISLLVKVSSN